MKKTKQLAVRTAAAEKTRQLALRTAAAEEKTKNAALLREIDSHLNLDIYIIDSGWHSTAHAHLAREFDLFKAYLSEHNLYVLTPQQSVDFLKKHPELIGRDPVIAVVDRLARDMNNLDGFGTRLELGMIEDPARIDWLLRMFVRVINSQAEILDIANTFRKYNYKEGVKGTIEIIMETLGTLGQQHH